jgi:TfoX/Sxy family transcriptional regulator of competence genes
MAYDEELAERIRELFATDHDVAEKKMFGGLAFLIGGNMSVSASGQGGLLLRCDPEETETLIREPHVDRFEMRGRAMDGWLRVDAAAVESREELKRWVAIGVDYARSLPPKS